MEIQEALHMTAEYNKGERKKTLFLPKAWGMGSRVGVYGDEEYMGNLYTFLLIVL
jgi:hypothetical protein